MVAIVVLIRIIPNSINAIAKARELETEKLLLKSGFISCYKMNIR